MMLDTINRLLSSTNLSELGTLEHEVDGYRNEFGEWVKGGLFVKTTIQLISWPLDDAERNVLPEGLRKTGSRKFLARGNLVPLAPDSRGDIIFFAGTAYRIAISKYYNLFDFSECVGIFPVTA